MEREKREKRWRERRDIGRGREREGEKRDWDREIGDKSLVHTFQTI